MMVGYLERLLAGPFDRMPIKWHSIHQRISTFHTHEGILARLLLSALELHNTTKPAFQLTVAMTKNTTIADDNEKAMFGCQR